MKLPDWWIPWAREEAAPGGVGWFVVKTPMGRRVTVFEQEVRDTTDDELAALISKRCADEDEINE